MSDGATTYAGHRDEVLALRAQDVGIDPLEHPLGLWGVVFEMGLSEGASVTLLSLVDGTTSLYASSGSAITGGGAHEAVAAASRALVDAVRAAADALEPDAGAAPPPVDEATLRALTADGRRAATVHLTDAVSARHALSVPFVRGHAVIAAIGEVTAGDVTGDTGSRQ